METRGEQELLNTKHAKSPERGDYWHEMFHPIRVVLGVTSDIVTFCETTKPTSKDRWTWDLSKVNVVPLKDFGPYLHYQSEPMKHKTWADVAPRSHIEFSDWWLAHRDA